MNDDPFESPRDRPLDDELARRLITSQFPELGPIRVTGRYGGADNHAVEIDSAWIFRFPKRAECEPMLLRELGLLPHLQGVVPVLAPSYEHVGAPSTEYPWAFAGYRKLAGTPAISCPPGMIRPDDLARSIGRILSVLHGHGAEVVERWGVVRLDEFEDVAAIRAGALENLDRVRSALPPDVFEPCREFVADTGGHAFEAGPLRDVLLHGDVHAEHLLVDPAGQVVGLIDWADACLGDPAYDLKFLWVWPGEDFVEEVLSFYDGPIDPGFLDRVRFYGVCTAVDEVAYGLSESRDENLRRGLATLRRTFAAGGPAR